MAVCSMRRRQAHVLAGGSARSHGARGTTINDLTVMLLASLLVLVVMSLHSMGRVSTSAQDDPTPARVAQGIESRRAAARQLDDMIRSIEPQGASGIRARVDNAAEQDVFRIDGGDSARISQEAWERERRAVSQREAQRIDVMLAEESRRDDETARKSEREVQEVVDAANAALTAAISAKNKAVPAQVAASDMKTPTAVVQSKAAALQQPRLRGSNAAAGVALPGASEASQTCERYKPLYANMEQDLRHVRSWVQREGRTTFRGMIEAYKEQLRRPGNEDYFMSMMMIKDNKLYCVPSAADGQELAFKKPTMITRGYDGENGLSEKKRLSWCYPVEISIDRQQRIFLTLHEMLKRFKVPDTFFMVHTRDSALFFPSKEKHPIIVFADAKRKFYQDMLMPGHTFTNGLNTAGTWENFVRVVAPKTAATTPWAEKKNQCLWRGTETSGRVKFVEVGLPTAAMSDKNLYNVKFSAGYRARKYAPFVSIAEHAKYKFLLHLDGTGYSSRYMKLLALNSITLKQRSPHYEFFEPALKPYVHYLPFSLNDKGDEMGLAELTNEMVKSGYLSMANLTGTMRWAIKNDKEARQIANNGMKFVRDYLVMDGAYCYWQEMLSRLSKLQAPGLQLPADAELFDPKVHAPDAVDVISGA